MKRGVGYCMNIGGHEQPGCEDYAKGMFLLNHGEKFFCPRCRHLGTVVKETGHVDRGEREDAPFKEVRVEFNYDPCTLKFREIAIVRDEAIWGTGRKYTLLSPLIKTEKRALNVAESVLANLQRYAELSSEDEIPRSTEMVLSLDDDFKIFSKNMKALGKSWEESSLSQARNTRPPKRPEVEKTKVEGSANG